MHSQQFKSKRGCCYFFHVIYEILLFFRIALDEITRQLRLENTLGDRVFGTFAETLAFLLQALRGGNSESLPILFILEEFDLFAHHKNQTLLYNLLDITQAGLTPMAVVGVTCRIDVMELLEKRVKSRFSHRQFFVCNRWSFDDYVDGFVNLLHFSPESKKKHYRFKSQYKQWNSNIQKLSRDPSVIEILKKQFHISKETPGLQALLTLPVAKLSDNHSAIAVADIADSERVIFADSKLSLLRGVTMLELCLIIAMNHLSNIHSGEPFNFQMVYNEFLKFSQKKSHVLQNYSKAVVFKAYEHLVELEFLQPKDNRITIASKVSKDYRPMLLLITDRQLKEAIDKYPDCNTDVKQWAESSFI